MKAATATAGLAAIGGCLSGGGSDGESSWRTQKLAEVPAEEYEDYV